MLDSFSMSRLDLLPFRETDMVELSIIIPTFNRRVRLQACLEALTAQTLAASAFEVIVVVDGSTDGTSEMLDQFATPFRLRPIWQANAGWSAALNRGVRAAEGLYCLFLDDDIVVEPETAEEHLRVQRANGGAVGVGALTLRIPEDADWFVRAYAESWKNHYSELNECQRTPTWLDCFGGNLSAPRSVLLRIGGVSPDLARGRDIELGYRLQHAGLPIQYIPRALGHQDEQKGFAELAADFQKGGASWVEIYRRHPPVLPHLLGSYHHRMWRSIFLQWLFFLLSVPPSIAAFLIQLTGKRDYRTFHFLRNYCYWRGVKQAADPETWRRLTSGTHILMYHAFCDSDDPAGVYVVPVRRFARQMAWLRRLGFKVISLDEFLQCRTHHRLPPARSLVITIDDGYLDTHKLAFPILARYQYPVTVFLVSEEVAASNRWSGDADLLGRPLLSWTDVDELHAQGVQFGSHTRTHPHLTRLPTGSLREEIRGSRADIEEKLRVPIRVFAYPYGESDPRVESVVNEAGYLASCGIEPGINTLLTPNHALRRTEIFGTDSLLVFLGKLWLGESRLWRLFRRPHRRKR
jgi:glycosyltransferase involved in cell wall biosynthesis/peptidoglycan/xylan/chitin deacetylase (PgdA/CDA1 family)